MDSLTKMRIETEAARDGRIEIIETEKSRYSPFGVRIVLVDPFKLGTHEDCLEGYNFEEIDFRVEYCGPAIAVAQFDMSDSLYLDGKGRGLVFEIEEYGDLGVLDGRHRLERARRLGFSLVPVQIFPARDPNLMLGTWLENFSPLTIEEVVKYFKHPDVHVLPKATKFQARGTDGLTYRLADIQPRVRVATKYLVKNEENS